MVWTQALHTLMEFDHIGERSESWEGLLAMTDVSTSWAEDIFRVKWQLEIQTNAVLLWSAWWLVVGRVMWLIKR